jgi:hypothetical protein
MPVPGILSVMGISQHLRTRRLFAWVTP